MRRNKLVLLLLPAALSIAVLACGGDSASGTGSPETVMPEVQDDMVGTGTLFIWAIGNGDEQLAMSLLSARTQTAVAQYCENGEVIACFTEVGIQNWGTANDIAFLPGFSHESTAVYGVGWSTDAHIWVVLEIVTENGEWRVDSWRGWIPSRASEGEIPYGLFEGTDTTNLFPPDE